MGLFDAVRNLFVKPAPAARPVAPLVDEPDPEEVHVPEWQVGQVLAALHGDAPPLLLDVREPYEWRQVRVPGALHIPMNNIPQRLAELPHDRAIAVFCAHGSRSFGVTHFLRAQGFDAYN
ncbi:MAG: rhodanese-like domain-containing protein, partial [Caldilinea sp.]|nr:rhodanese-like domain-containing protein [Caldilinea sp.]